MHARPARSSLVRLAFGAAGWCAVALAIAGALLPGLPTTVFVLIASYCFSKSSRRFERWLRGNRWLGPVVERFGGHDGMPASTKRRALVAMWTSVLASAALLAVAHPATAAFTIGLGLLGTLSIRYGVRTAAETSPSSVRP